MVRKLPRMDQIMKQSYYWFLGTYRGIECAALVVDLTTFVNAQESALISVSVIDEQGEEELISVVKGEVVWNKIEAC